LGMVVVEWNAEAWSRRERISHRLLLVLLAVYAVALPLKAYDIVNHAGLGAAVCAAFLLRGNLLRTEAKTACRLMLAALILLLTASVLSVLTALLDRSLPWKAVEPAHTFLFGACVVFALGFGLCDAAWVARLLWLMLIAYGIFLLIDVACAGQMAESWEHGRFIGLRRSPTAYSKELLQILALYLGSALMIRNRLATTGLLLGAFIAGVLLMMTGTRFALLTAALVTLPAAALVAMASHPLRKKLLLLLAWLVVVPLIGYGWYVSNPSRRSLASAELRVEHWKLTEAIARRAPWYKLWVGHGQSRSVFESAANRYTPEAYNRLDEQFRHAHNDVLQTFIATGLLGVIALTAVWTLAFGGALVTWRAERSTEPGPSLAGVFVIALVTVAAMSQFDCTMRNKVQAHIAWLITGLAWAWFRLRRPTASPKSLEPEASPPDPGKAVCNVGRPAID
jgi:O-antigen ligase